MNQDFSTQARTLANQASIAPKGAKAMFLGTVEKTSQLNQMEMMELIRNINEGRLALRPYAITVIERLSGQSVVRVFDTAREKIRGIRSVHNGRLPEGHIFVPNKMTLKTATLTPTVAGSPTNVEIVAGDFVGVHTRPNLRNGLLTLGVDGEKFISEFPCDEFDTRGNNYVRTGEFELDSSFVIVAQKEIKAEIDMHTSIAGIPQDTYLMFKLSGFAAVHV